jgi:hypothetical protein
MNGYETSGEEDNKCQPLVLKTNRKKLYRKSKKAKQTHIASISPYRLRKLFSNLSFTSQ